MFPTNPRVRLKNRLRLSVFWFGLGGVLCCLFPSPAQSDNGSFRQLVAQKATREWLTFNDPNRPVVKSSVDVSQLERDPLEYRKCLRINQYWAAVPSRFNRPPNVNTCAFNSPPTPQGQGKVSSWNVFPWSAAFVSFIMKESGAGDSFQYSGRHATYIVDAVRNRNHPNHPFRGYPIKDERPAIGDLLCAPRGESKGMAYEEIVRKGDFQSHCDIVVAKNGASSIEVIGGNVGDTVAKTIVSLTGDGYVDVSDPTFRNWFVLIKYAVRP
jgi:hypothetical protein